MEKRRLLPSNTQDFVKIREMGYVYVDKTARIHQLISSTSGACFLSRPRRFGKSLLCSTIGAIFEGRRELFQEIAGYPALAIDSLDWGWEEHPVIRIDLNPGNYSAGIEILSTSLSRQLKSAAKRFDLVLEDMDCANQFASLIEMIHDKTGKRVAVIIDEYDKPLLETIDKPQLHIELRGTLKGFYGVLKHSDEHLRFAFITGVSKFSHVSIFSDLNQLSDLTLNPRYADICGFTQEELEQNFDPEIAKIVEENCVERKNYMEKLRTFYNGYRFSKKALTVYNPFGMINHFFNDGEFQKYWYESGSPSFLIKLITEQKINIVNLNEMTVRLEDFRRYDVENMKAVPVLYQAGYLTITDYNDEREIYTLNYPNEEVRSAFAKTLVEQYLKAPDDRSRALFYKLPDALDAGDIANAIDILKQFLAGIPYDLIKDTENYFHNTLHIIFSIFGLDCLSEHRVAAGRMDAKIETKNIVYCFEFKFNKTADEALAQINSKDYLLPWTGQGKKLFKVGVNFDPKTRNINEWKCEIVEAENS